MTKKILAVLAGLAVALGIGAVQATPAFAAHVGPAGYVTFWDGCTGGSSSNHTVGYCGAAWPIPQSQLGQGVCHNVPTGSNDRFSAFDNNTSRDIVVYTNANCSSSGSNARLYAGTMTGQLATGWNNTISSYS
jgi:hypothetical protein